MYTDPQGQDRPLLTADEARDLTIRRGTLNAEELAHIRSHARLGREYLSKIPWSDDLKLIPCIAGDHHETMDGSGYPRGLKGDQVIPQVRILTICDIYDALTAADRPYKKAQPDSVANRILREEAARGKLDEDMVEFFTAEIVPRIRETKERHR
jgi:HD-GYP domain-containing protein (c-di-GMP phosphodiesterase class II)